MPGKKDAAWWRDYRARQAAAPDEVATRLADTATGEVTKPDPGKYDCGCEPGLPCIGHGIARMPQAAQEALRMGMATGSPEPWRNYIAKREVPHG